MGNSSKRDARDADQAEQQRKALELRKAGATYDQIAQQLEVANRSVAWKLVKAAIDEIIREPAEEVLRLEIERLDAMLLGCWTKAKSGDPHAIDRALRIMDRRAAFLGLDAPKRNEHTGRDGSPIIFDLTGITSEQLRASLAEDDAGNEGVASPADPSGAGAPRTGDGEPA